MSAQEPSNLTTVGPENCNTAEAQDKDLKVDITNMIEVPEEDVNKSLKEIYENTNSG